jgi:methionyl-tRNA formyltransferase
MRVEREMDAGPVAIRRELAIAPDENAGELAARVALLTAEAIDETLSRIEAGSVTWTPQPAQGVTFAPKLSQQEAELDFGDDAEALARRVRAFAPEPGAWTRLDGERFAILAARAEPGAADAAPGSVRTGAGALLRIATGAGWLLPLVVQRAGGRPLAIDAYLRGRPISDGKRLGA